MIHRSERQYRKIERQGGPQTRETVQGDRGKVVHRLETVQGDKRQGAPQTFRFLNSVNFRGEAVRREAGHL